MADEQQHQTNRLAAMLAPAEQERFHKDLLTVLVSIRNEIQGLKPKRVPENLDPADVNLLICATIAWLAKNQDNGQWQEIKNAVMRVEAALRQS